MKYPNVKTIPSHTITNELIQAFLEQIKAEKRNIVITPINLLRLNGAPVSSNNWILTQKLRLKKIKQILKELELKGIIEKRDLKQDFLGIKEIGYNLVE